MVGRTNLSIYPRGDDKRSLSASPSLLAFSAALRENSVCSTGYFHFRFAFVALRLRPVLAFTLNTLCFALFSAQGSYCFCFGTACYPTVRPAPTFSELPEAPRSTSITWPGKKVDGSVLLPNQWSLHPTGRQIELADFPVNLALHPDGRYAAVLHAGYSEHQILIVDLLAGEVISKFRIHETFYGLEFYAGRKNSCLQRGRG